MEYELYRRYAGKLLLRSEILVDDPFFEQLVKDGYLTPKPSIKKTWGHYKCQRCGNQKPSLFGTLPCYNCKRTHVYCRKCIDMGRVMECLSLYEWTGDSPGWGSHSNACSWSGNLTPPQQKASDRIIQAIRQREKDLLVWAVCGAGKTEMLYPGISEALRIKKRVCIATPRADVVRELLPRLRAAFSGVYIQGLYGGSLEKDGTAQLIITTTHQLLRYSNAFDVMIIDEVDAFPYTKDPTLPFSSERAKSKNCTTIYLTATPRKEYKKNMSQKKLPFIFVPRRFHNQPLPVPAFRMCFSLKKDLADYRPPESFYKWFEQRTNRNRQVLIFVPTISLADNLTQLLANRLTRYKIMAVHAADENREGKVQAFREKQYQLLVTTTILERGVTFPSVDVAVLDAGHNVFDEAALVQIAGRAGRSPDDPDGEVVFFHDGKTEAMVEAEKSIIKMNRRGGFR